MKKIFIFIFSLCSLVGVAQKKNISAVEATSNFSLYPRPLYYLKWIKDSHNYVYIKDSKFTIFDASTQKEGNNSIICVFFFP